MDNIKFKFDVRFRNSEEDPMSITSNIDVGGNAMGIYMAAKHTIEQLEALIERVTEHIKKEISE